MKISTTQDLRNMLYKAVDRIDELENQVFNLSEYINYVSETHYEVYEELMEEYDGMPGYTEWIADEDGEKWEIVEKKDPEREKILQALKKHLGTDNCDDCPYLEKDECRKQLLKDVFGWLWELGVFPPVKAPEGANSITISIPKEAEPVRRGKWIWSPVADDGTVSGCCNKCSFSHVFIGGHTAQYNYCPSCGARMEEEE